MYMHTEELVKSGFGQFQRQQFNLYWMTNQPYVTGQELTGNQCIQPPILHQYNVSHSCHRPAHLAVFLPLLFHLSFFLSVFFWLCLCSVLLWKPLHLYFKDVFVSLLCIQMIRLTGRRMQLRRRAGWREKREERWRAGFWSRVSPNRYGMRWWQLEECTADSPNAGHMTFGLACPPEQFERSGWSGERKTSIYNVRIIYCRCTHHDSIPFPIRTACVCRNMSLLPWSQTAWPVCGFP